MLISMEWGFNPSWYITKICHSVVVDYANYITNSGDHTVMASLTWMFHEQQCLDQLVEVVEKNNVTNVIFYELLDDEWIGTNRFIAEFKNRVGQKVNCHYLGNKSSPYERSWFDNIHIFSGMGLIYSLVGARYTNAELYPVDDKFEQVFLCYLGKDGHDGKSRDNIETAHDARQNPRRYFWENIKHLEDQNTIYFKGYSKELPNNLIESAVSDVSPRSEYETDEQYNQAFKELFWDGSLGLGNMEYWRKSFLRPVFETVYAPATHDRDNPHKIPFNSEKTFKPIVGHRPFLICGDTNTNNWLLEHQFYTFNSYFGYPEHQDITVHVAIDIINNLTLKEANQMWKFMKPEVVHNYKVYQEYTSAVAKLLMIDNTVKTAIINKC